MELTPKYIVEIFESAKDTTGKDWKHNKKRLVKLIKKCIKQEIKKNNLKFFKSKIDKKINKYLKSNIIFQ
jgi:hypothetical protein